MIPQDLRERYQSDGFCVVPSVVPLEQLDDILRDIHSVAAAQAKICGVAVTSYQGAESVQSLLEAIFRASVDRYLAAVRLVAKLASISRLCACEALENLARGLGLATLTQPTSPVFHIMGDKLRIPGGYFGVVAHQDWPSIQGALDVAVTWIPLADVSSDQFPLEVIPRSHRRGLWPGVATEYAYEIAANSFTESDFVRVPVKAGDVVVFHGFTVHRTALAGCSGFRAAVSSRYEDADEPTFADRKFPCAYRRTVARELFLPNFPSAEEVQAALIRRPPLS